MFFTFELLRSFAIVGELRRESLFCRIYLYSDLKLLIVPSYLVFNRALLSRLACSDVCRYMFGFFGSHTS